MSDVNVSLILRLVDRLSAPATAAAGRLGALAGAGGRLRSVSIAASAAMDRQVGATARTAAVTARPTTAATGSASALSRVTGESTLAAAATNTMGGAVRAAAAAQAGAAGSARTMAAAETAVGSATTRAAEAASGAVARFSAWTVGLMPSQMREVRRNIFGTANKLGLSGQSVAEVHAAVANENVYNDPRSLGIATTRASEMQLLAAV